MRLLEYEAKNLLEKSGAVTPAFQVVTVGEPVTDHPAYPAVIKSQVPIGGRGKAGGVVIAENDTELTRAIKRIGKLEIKGFTPQRLLLEPKLPIAREHYLSLLLNRETASIQLMAHAEGGVEVESARGFFTVDIAPETISDIAAQVANVFEEDDTPLLTNVIARLYECFVSNDALLLEINPLVKTADDIYVCADAKMELDDAATFRHRDWDFEDKPSDVNFVTLDKRGEVATIANGAGLAMATVDAVAAAGMKPANFLDVGGGANKESVLRAFKRIMEYPSVKAIIINIFAGITRCDEVAKAIIAARAEIEHLPPLFIRLAGTNYEAATPLLEAENIPLKATLEECLAAAREVVL